MQCIEYPRMAQVKWPAWAVTDEARTWYTIENVDQAVRDEEQSKQIFPHISPLLLGKCGDLILLSTVFKINITGIYHILALPMSLPMKKFNAAITFCSSRNENALLKYSPPGHCDLR
jgi:hypothetical protein